MVDRPGRGFVRHAPEGTLLETGAGGPGGGLVPPGYQPGVVEKLFEPLGVADVFATSNVTGSQVRYVVEGTATNAAAGVAEAGVKPESTIALSEATEAIRKIATVLPVSDELLEDAASVQQYLNGWLTLFVRLEEERQLLRGSGAGSNELLGIFGRSGINTDTKLATDDKNAWPTTSTRSSCTCATRPGTAADGDRPTCSKGRWVRSSDGRR
jgi:HK97 family phage major capsid protein